MNILVTGGAGFIGSHLCEKLIDGGDFVFCLDNLFTGTLDNLQSVLNNHRFVFVKHDIVDPILLEEKIDQVYNLACPASPVHYQFDAIHTVKANTIGVINVLDFANKNKAVVLQASTSEVYGDPQVHPQVETYRGNVNPIGPRACYDEGKRCAETLFFDYHRSHGLKIKVARIFNTYGPRMFFDDGRVVSNMILQAITNADISIYGNGSQTRSFCYVDDTVDGLVKLMNSEDCVTGPINLGNPDERTILNLASEIIELVGSRSKLAFKDLPVDDPTRRCPNISSAKQYLGWEPAIGLDEGLRFVIEDFRNRLVKQGLI